MQVQLTTALAASLLLGAAAPDDTVTLQFAPSPGTVSTHSVTMERAIESGDLAVTMDGNEVPAEFLPELNLEISVTTGVEITDHFLPDEEDITGLWRKRTLKDVSETFDMGMTYAGDRTNFSAEATSELDGHPFLIGRDSDGDVVARWADPESKLATSLLDDVRPDVQLEALLPEKPVAMDDTWEADASALTGLLDLSRTLPWTWTGMAADNIPAPAETNFEGTLELRVIDIRTDDEVVLCTMSVTGDIVETGTRATDLEKVPVADGTATETTTTTYAVEGELVWNVTAAHLATFEMKGEGEGEQLTSKDAGQPGPDYRSTMQHSTVLNVEVK